VRRALVLLALTALIVTGCGENDASSRTAAPAAGLPDHVVVFTPDDLDDAAALFSGEATWTPSAAEVRRADAAVRARVARTSGIAVPYGDHVRQVAGLEGDVVLVNGLCDDSFDWREEWVTVLDGGACFWQAAVRDGVVVSFSVNGEA
jgi:hypothetical protein